MTNEISNHQPFLDLVNGVTRLVAGDTSQVDKLTALYAHDAFVVYFGDPGNPLHGREELRTHFSKVPERFAAPRFRGFRAENIRIHDDKSDPEVIVAEFAYVSDGDGDDPALNLPCCFVIRVRDGEIVETRDYVLGSM